MWNKENCDLLQVGMQHGAVTLEKHVAISYKIKHSLTRSVTHAPGDLPTWFENLCLHKSQHVHANWSFIPNSPQKEVNEIQ